MRFVQSIRLPRWLVKRFHSSVRIGPFWVSTWDWEAQHACCCQPHVAESD